VRGGERATNRLVGEFPLIIVSRVTCINPASAPRYNNASVVFGNSPVCPSCRSLRCYFRTRSAETTSSCESASQSRIFLRDTIFNIEWKLITGISGYAARPCSRSLSCRQSFSITVRHNYKGARNCSLGTPFNTEIAKCAAASRCAPLNKISFQQMNS